jgi:hypothetical protein
MAAQSNSGTTTASLNKYWLKVQGKIATAFAHGKRKEKKLFDSLPAAPEPWSGYENTFPIDVNERGGIAGITDFGYMAKASSVNAVEATVSAVHYQGRFAISDIAGFADQGKENQQRQQLVVQGMQKVEAMVEHFSDYFHGSASGLLATTDSDFSDATTTATLAAGYGVAGITNAKFLASLFKVGERVVFLDSSNALIDSTDSFGEITAVSKTNGTIDVTTDGSITYSTNGVRIYKANNLEGTTAAGGSDLNKGLVGMIDIMTAATLHNVATSSVPNWAVAYSDTNAGRFSHSKLRKGKDEIENESGLTPDTLLLAQGVYRDMIAQERAGLRYDDAGGLSFDGDVKAKGLQIITSKNVPPGYVNLFAKAGMNKWEILPTTERPSWGDLQASETLAGKFGRIDWFGNNVVRNRKAFAYWTSQTEA